MTNSEWQQAVGAVRSHRAPVPFVFPNGGRVYVMRVEEEFGLGLPPGTFRAHLEYGMDEAPLVHLTLEEGDALGFVAECDIEIKQPRDPWGPGSHCFSNSDARCYYTAVVSFNENPAVPSWEEIEAERQRREETEVAANLGRLERMVLMASAGALSQTETLSMAEIESRPQRERRRRKKSKPAPEPGVRMLDA